VTRIVRIGLAATLSAGALASIAGFGELASAAPGTLQGRVGPGFSISVTKAGRKVASLKAGRYTLVVDDRSSAHNFRLSGPGLNRAVTGVAQVGVKRITITLRRGVYRFVCDPHAGSMAGSFRVV
jgi:hypothetical protein